MNITTLKQLFEIDPSIPNGLRWKRASQRIHVGDPAGYFEPARGCYVSQLKGKVYLNHKIIYALTQELDYSAIKVKFTHLNGDSKDNSIANIGLLKESFTPVYKTGTRLTIKSQQC